MTTKKKEKQLSEEPKQRSLLEFTLFKTHSFEKAKNSETVERQRTYLRP